MIPGGYYIKARCIQESDIAHCPPHFREIWDWLLMQANHKPKMNGQRLDRGQVLTSYKKISDALSWKVGYRVQRYKKHEIQSAMKWLMKHTMVATTKTTRGMIVTIIKYNKYQDPKNYETSNETHNEHTMNLHDRQECKERKKRPLTKKSKISLPKDFKLTSEMREYADRVRYIGDVERFTEYFKDSCLAHNYKYVDWTRAWQTWLRKRMEDKPELQGKEVELV